MTYTTFGKPEPGWVHLMSVDPYQLLVCRLGEENPRIISGYGGWEVVQRARRRSLVDWQNVEPYRLTFSVVLDGYAENQSVEAEIRKLERMAIPALTGESPTKVRVFGYLPMDNTRNQSTYWVVENLEWGDSLRSRVGMVRVRQTATLTLLAVSSDDELRVSRSPRPRKKPGSKVKRYKVRAGDTLQKIAAKYLGSSRRWKEIATLNKIRDPKRLKAGTILKLP